MHEVDCCLEQHLSFSKKERERVGGIYEDPHMVRIFVLFIFVFLSEYLFEDELDSNVLSHDHIS